jgi:hypothetical protein
MGQVGDKLLQVTSSKRGKFMWEKLAKVSLKSNFLRHPNKVNVRLCLDSADVIKELLLLGCCQQPQR